MLLSIFNELVTVDCRAECWDLCCLGVSLVNSGSGVTMGSFSYRLEEVPFSLLLSVVAYVSFSVSVSD